jgi:hypothetical protein
MHSRAKTPRPIIKPIIYMLKIFHQESNNAGINIGAL